MNKTRRSSMMIRIVAVLAVTMMFTMCFVGGTFAKYTSSSTGTGTATVAKWDIRVGSADGTNITTSDTFTFDLFETLKESDLTANETDVTGDSIIAPGTGGEFNIAIYNQSEVTAKYAIDYTVNKNGIPVQFSVDDGATWTDDLTDITAGAATTLAAKSGSTVDSDTITVQWRWIFDGNDSIDTALGIDGTAQLVVTAVITATQVD